MIAKIFLKFVTLHLYFDPVTMALKRKRPVHRQDDSNKRHKVLFFSELANWEFESFSDRIEKLSIDVLRKVRPVIPDSGADDEDSYVASLASDCNGRRSHISVSR